MPQLRLALAQVNPTVGDLAGNAALVRRAVGQAATPARTWSASPRWCSPGTRWRTWRCARRSSTRPGQPWTGWRADLRGTVTATSRCVVGYVDRLDADPDGMPDPDRLGVPKGSPQNCAALLHRGTPVARYAKHHLPNYGVFDEFRIFVPGRDLTVVRVRGVDVAIAICEDLWQDGGPVAQTRAARAGLLLSPNASPYERNKDDARLALVTRRAAEAGCTLAYVNMVGGQDDLVFDGDSIVVDAAGTVLARGPQFAETLLLVDLDVPAGTTPVPRDGVVRVVLDDEPVPGYRPRPGPIAPALDGPAEVYQALVVGLRDYVRKNGFGSVVLGLSGGIDSALVAAIACDAVGAGNVVGVSMPSGYSSEHSKDDAADLAKRTGLDYRVVPIAPMVQAFQDGLGLTGIAAENLQATGPRRDPDGDGQPGGSPDPDHGQQVRARSRVLDHLRGLGRRLRAA